MFNGWIETLPKFMSHLVHLEVSNQIRGFGSLHLALKSSCLVLMSLWVGGSKGKSQ